MRVGYLVFPQGNVPAESERLPDSERMRRELGLLDLAGELGFDELWATEHHFGDYNIAPAPLQLLAYAAGRFPGRQLGTMVVVLPWNDPLRVVEQIVQLDYLAGGRLTIGFGKGEARREFDAYGLELAEARARFDDSLDLVVSALESGVFERPGQPRVEVRPRPAGAFADRLYMAGGSPASLERAASAGLGLLRVGLRSWQEVATQVGGYRERYAATQGHEPPPTVTLVWGYVDADAGRARELGQAYARAYRKSAIDHYELGPDEEAELDAFADCQLWGTPDQVVEKALAIRELTGTERLVVAFRYAGVPYEAAEQSMRLFAREVTPRLCAG